MRDRGGGLGGANTLREGGGAHGVGVRAAVNLPRPAGPAFGAAGDLDDGRLVITTTALPSPTALHKHRVVSRGRSSCQQTRRGCGG